jgi:hypothetical protein
MRMSIHEDNAPLKIISEEEDEEDHVNDNDDSKGFQDSYKK